MLTYELIEIVVLGTVCPFAESRQVYQDVVQFIREDPTCTNFFMAYALSLRAHNGSSLSANVDRERAQELYSRGMTSLTSRIANAASRNSNQSIQAVLLLIAYTADFSSPEDISMPVSTHISGLGAMIKDRGGIDEGSLPPALRAQLVSIHTSKFFHLTLDCTNICGSLGRFPEGLGDVIRAPGLFL